MYFDTLKVSSLEQTAEETSARGGIGNPNLITWDFGKEITVSLEDALYTPASQSDQEKQKLKVFGILIIIKIMNQDGCINTQMNFQDMETMIIKNL